MSSRGLANFAIGAGAGYLKVEDQQRTRARQDKVDQQNTALYDVRMRRENGLLDDADRLRADNTTLRTAAQPIAPVQDGSGGMLKADDMDNRDVGLPDNAGRPDGGLSLANFRVGQQSFAGKGEADAAAAKLNTPQASALRLADAQRKIGDVGAANKTISDERSRAADQMLKDIGVGLGQGGWGGFTEALSKSAADQTDYSHAINPATGKVDITQTDRKTGGSRTIGSYDDNDAGKLDAFKITASYVAKKPDVAMAHQADRLKTARADRKLDIEEGYKTGILDAKIGELKARAEQGNKVPPGYRTTADGNLEPIPGGPATAEGKPPPAAKPLNDTQSKALLFGSRMREADKILGRLATEGTTTSVPGSRGALGGVINAGSPGNSQMLDQAKRDFTNAVLRRESGAVIADSEFANADRQYFPQIGDSAKTVEQKANNRRLALDGILLEVPEAHRNTLQPRNADNTPFAMPKTVADMKPGGIYQTSRGPAKWNGTAFEAQ